MALSGSLPYGKKLTNEEVQFLWLLLPADVKAAVTDEMWAYGCSQRMLDPDPSKDLALHLQVLSYLFRIRDGQPAFDWGVKADLHHRMALPSCFHAQQQIPAQEPQYLLEPQASNPVLSGGFDA
ncbi:hypothetical protein [Vulcanococcus sp.]|uniref:hypothetical protein n=1 Tax=Vulcanococcus sp. TaxID=2856995 RepID=UPI003F696C2A